MRPLVLPQKYENLQFDSYDDLHHKFCDPDFDPEKLTEFDSSGKKHLKIPPLRPLKFLTNLIVIKLANNNISRFEPENLVVGAPKLRVLDLHKNKIDVLDDLVELGTLKDLRELNILENPVCGYLLRIKIIQFLLFPEKYKKYDAVKILTATYENIHTKITLNPKQEEERKKYERFMEKIPAEVDKKELQKSRVNKYDRKNTLIKNAMIPCPVPRKSRFPNLEKINEKIISLTDIESITLQPYKNILYTKEELNMIKTSKKIEHSDQHEKYIERYRKKMERKIMDHGELLFIKNKGDEKERDELKLLSQLDQENYNRKKIFGGGNLALWEKPADVKYKDAPGFTISMEEYKQMIQDYEKEKERKKAEKKSRIKKVREKIIKAKRIKEKNRKKKAGKYEVDFDNAPDLEESYHNIDSDPEMKRLFNIKRKKRPKTALELQNNEASFINSSETSMSERNPDGEEDLSDEEFENRLKNFASSFYESASENQEFLEMSRDSAKAHKAGTDRKGGDPAGKSRLGAGLDLKSKIEDVVAEDSAGEMKSPKKERKKFLLRSHSKKEFTNRVFTTKEEAERREQQRIKREEREAKEAALREAEALKESKMKKAAAAALISSTRKLVEKRVSQKTSRRGSFESKEGEKTPSMQTPMNHSGQGDERFDTHSQKETSRGIGSRNELPKIDEELSKNRPKKDFLQDPLKEKLDTLAAASYNFSGLVKKGDTPGNRSEQNYQQKSGDIKLVYGQQQQQPENQKEMTNGAQDNDYFNFTGALKQNPDVEAISNIQSNQPSRDQSQAGNELAEEVREALQIVEERRSAEKSQGDTKVEMKPINPSEAEIKHDVPLDSDRKRDELHSQLDEKGVMEYLNELNQGGETERQIQGQNIDEQVQTTHTEFQNEVIRTHHQQQHQQQQLQEQEQQQYHNQQQQRPQSGARVSVYEMAQTYIRKRPGTATVSTTLFNPELGVAQERQDTSHLKKRVQLVRKQDARSSNVKNKVFFNRSKEVEQRKNSMQTLPPAPPLKKLYGSQFKSAATLKKSESITRESSQQQFGLSLNKDMKEGVGETLKSLPEESVRPATAQPILKSVAKGKFFDSVPKVTVTGAKAASDVRPMHKLDLTPPHLIQQPAPVTLESLLPRPEEGIDEATKLKILNSRNEEYAKLNEIVKLIQDSRKIKEEILSVLGPSSTFHTGTEKKTVPFEKITDFLMQRSGSKKLKQEDKDDLRDLIFSVNDDKADNAPKLTYKWIEEKMEDVLKGRDKNFDIDKLSEFYDILKNIDDRKLSSRGTNMLKQVEKKEIERAEHNAVLAAHYQRLKKYYGEDFIRKHFKEYFTLNQNEQQVAEANRLDKQKDLRTPAIILTTTGKYAPKNYGTEVEQRMKAKSSMDYSAGPLKPVEIKGSWAEAWPNINEVFNSRKQKVRPMDRFEDMFESFQRKLADGYNQGDQKPLTMEEKMIRYAQDFKENSKKREDLKKKIDKNIREIRHNLDEFIEVNKMESEKRFDPEYCFREYAKALREGQL